MSDYEAARERMVDALLESGRIENEATARALRAVPRHEFVPQERRDRAYEDRPLPIGDGQTISAPHMVGIMLEDLELADGEKVLEIGTGCGYHAAVTAEIVGSGNVYSVEYSTELAQRARETLAELGYGGISVRQGDGHGGWPEHAPYEAIYLTCAADEIPDPLTEQLTLDGRFLGPIGRHRQQLTFARRRPDGSLEREDRGGVRFVPMRGGD